MNLSKRMNGPVARVLLAAALVSMMAGVAGAQGRGGGGFGGGAGGGGGGGGGGRGANAAPLRTTPVNASYDTRTNTVVVTGPTDTLTDILKIIHDIDSNPTPDNQVFVYKLKNGSALNIEAVANLLFTGTGGNNRGVSTANQLSVNGTTALGGGGTRGGAGGARGGGGGALGGGGVAGGGRAGGGGTATFGGVNSAAGGASAAGLVGQVSVVADPNTNSLLVTTNPKNWQQVKHILDELDRSVPQVLIKVLIAEVSHTDGTDLGADLSIMNLRLDTAGSLTEGQKAGTLFGAPSNGGQLVINESNFSATIHALQTVGKIDVLSRPYILATDNQLATITVGQTVPYVSNSQVTAQGNTINTVAYSNVGILLDVIPHINPDGMVILDVAPEISSLADSTIAVTTGVTAPVFNTRSAQSRVAVENGQTVVIGGLMQDQVNSTVNKIPLLGDIPWIGAAFQRKQDTKTKTELLIFLTPHVAMRPDQLAAMGNEELKTTKLVPNAVSPGTFQEHQKGLEAGATPPTTLPDAFPQSGPLYQVPTSGSQLPQSTHSEPAGTPVPPANGPNTP